MNIQCNHILFQRQFKFSKYLKMLHSDQYNYLQGLNKQQRIAVETLDGPVLVLSGAGTGKTRVLTTRIAHLLVTGKSKPWNIMAVTFTNKAAREMKERVGRIIGPSSEQVLMGTFHSLGARMLRQHCELIGLKSNFTIIDVEDQVKLLKQIISAKNVDDKRWPAKFFLNIISSWKDKGLTPSKITDKHIFQYSNGLIKDIYIEYQERLLKSNCVDFGDLLVHPLELLRMNSDVLSKWQSKITHILIDEYQDTNTAQYLWIRLLCSKHNNICCVGDDDQSIYGWRGAEVKNILNFSNDFENSKVIRLEQNYRSTNKILDVANCLIKNNTNRLGKDLWTENNSDQDVEIFNSYDSSDEARKIGEIIEDKIRDKVHLTEIAVLVRTFSLLRAIEERFISIGLPYRVIGTKFYDRQEIRDAIAYVRVLCNPLDDLAFERIINTPRRGIGPTTIKKLSEYGRQNDMQLFHSAENIVNSEIFNNRTVEKIAQFINQIKKWKLLKNEKKPMDILDQVLEESTYYEMWENEKSEEAETRINNLKELLEVISEFDTLEGFLQHVSLMTDNDVGNELGEVTLMTLHAAKGSEYQVIFLPGWEDGLFPSFRSLEEGGEDGLEEERRLAYVGITRAKKELFLSYASNRRINGIWMSSLPSRFLKELPKDIANKIEANDYSAYSLYDENVSYDYTQKFKNQGYGPGWKRMSELQINNVKDNNLSQLPKNSENNFQINKFIKGDRVFHVKFGMGNVININDDKLDIKFDNAGHKKIQSNFVKKQ